MNKQAELLSMWAFILAYCFITWYGILTGIEMYLSPLIHTIINTGD